MRIIEPVLYHKRLHDKLYDKNWPKKRVNEIQKTEVSIVEEE